MILITEWTKEGKILCDEDNSTPKIDGWKKFNTLKYYKVEDGAEMTLLEHQNCRTLPRSPNGKHYHTQLYCSRKCCLLPRYSIELSRVTIL